MPRRGEHIHKRKDGRWEARYKCGITDTGKAIYKSVYAKTYAEVKEKQQRGIAAYRRGSIQKGNITFGEAVTLWQEVNRSRHKGATNVRYVNLIEKHIRPDLDGIKISQLSSMFLSNFMNRKLETGRLDKKGGLSPAYVRSIMLVIRSVIDFAINEKLCPTIPVKIHPPTIQKKELEILSVSEQGMLEMRLLENLDETALGIYLSLRVGLRIGEVCALKWCDIDLTNAVMHVRATIARVPSDSADGSTKTKLIRDTPKTKASLRDIPISENIIRVMQKMQKKCVSEYVVSSTPDFVSPRTFEHRFHRILAENNIRNINFHALRHTFATRCVEAGVDIKSLSEILGHSNAAITLNTYVHSSMERKREQLEKLNHAAL